MDQPTMESMAEQEESKDASAGQEAPDVDQQIMQSVAEQEESKDPVQAESQMIVPARSFRCETCDMVFANKSQIKKHKTTKEHKLLFNEKDKVRKQKDKVK